MYLHERSAVQAASRIPATRLRAAGTAPAEADRFSVWQPRHERRLARLVKLHPRSWGHASGKRAAETASSTVVITMLVSAAVARTKRSTSPWATWCNTTSDPSSSPAQKNCVPRRPPVTNLGVVGTSTVEASQLRNVHRIITWAAASNSMGHLRLWN